MTCLCRHLDGRPLTAVPWSSPTRPGCPAHPADLCRASHRLFRSSSTGQPVATPCNMRLADGRCPNEDRHEGVTP